MHPHTALRHRFAGRILPVNERVAARCGEFMGAADQAGRPLPALDNLGAATAQVYGLTLAARDTGDIAPGVEVFNPFEKMMNRGKENGTP